MTDGTALESLRRQQRLIFRCATTFLRDLVARQIRRHEGDFTRAVVYMAAIQASRPAEPGAGQPPQPRVFSVRAIAQSLAIPYETTRRKVVELEARGLARRVGARGHVVAPALFDAAAHRADCEATWAALRGVIADLRALGFDFSQFAGGPTLSSARGLAHADMADAAAALVNDFVLRVLESGVGPHGSMLDALIFCAMLLVNAELLTNDPQLAWAYAGAGTPPPDALRRPATITGLADTLGLTHETVRRRVSHQREMGWITRVTGGYLITMERMQTPEILQTGLMASQHFLRLLESLRSLGVEIETLGLEAAPALS